jgi:hypothetical protein
VLPPPPRGGPGPAGAVGVGTLKNEGQVLTGPKEKADALNKQFESVFTVETPLPHTANNVQHPEAPPLSITINGVTKLLRSLKPGKAAGPDGIRPVVLKELAQQMSPLLTALFRKSYATGIIPDEWRHAIVTPAHKKGDRSKASNYRPISLTCVACKVMEHIVTSHIMRHADTNSILYKLQHGFRSKLSCETQLIEFIDDIANNMDSRIQTDVVVMDFSKAFEKVGHKRLLHKLQGYGICGKTNKWIKAFLNNRKQQVVVEGESSYTAKVISGVPQGSVLGPSLFLFFINDLAQNITSKIRLFADDTIAYLTIKSQDDAKTLQEDLNRLASWEDTWQMEFHPEKCQVIRITRNRTNVVNSSYYLHGHRLEIVEKTKYLGITICKDLRWNEHICNITNKANRSLAFLRRNLRVPCPRLKGAAYKALVRPLLEYASTVWDPDTTSNIKKIEAVQRRAARWVLSKHRRGPNTTPVTEMINTIGWPSLSSRRRNSRIIMLYKIGHRHVDIQLPPYITPLTHSHNTRYNKQLSLAIPTSNTNIHKNSFYPKTIRDWNNLPLNITNSITLDSFKSRLNKL